MFKKMINRKAISVLLFAIMVLGLATTASADRSLKTVKLKIENDQLVFVSKKGDNGCTLFSKRGLGCFKVKKKNQADITFQLIGNSKCNLDEGTDWKLSAVYLGGYDENNDKPADFGFVNTLQADFDKVDSDFGGVDKTTGLVRSAVLSNSKLSITDENQYKYMFWYKVEAVCERTDRNPAHVAVADPRGRNGGTN